MTSPPFGQQAGQVVLNRVVEAELALVDELHHDRRDVRLRQAADPERVVGADRRLRLEVGDAGAEHDRVGARVLDEQHRARDAGFDRRVELLLELAALVLVRGGLDVVLGVASGEEGGRAEHRGGDAEGSERDPSGCRVVVAFMGASLLISGWLEEARGRTARAVVGPARCDC